MVFSSTLFVFQFLAVVLGIYFLVPGRWKNGVLLLASLFFYAWGETFFVLLMLASISVNYGLGLLIGRNRGTPLAKRWLALAVVVNLATLAYFKYANFAVENWNTLALRLGLEPIEWTNIHLPLGISFFTFQAMSYVIDVYRGDVAVQRSPFRLSLYISLFPQLIAGPIVRYREVESQLANRLHSIPGFAHGVRRFAIGMSKKVLLANPLSVPVEAIFALPDEALTPAIAWLGVVSYMLQLYFDFSGYSDMAIGLGHMLGFKFPENFRYPFAARTVRDLWTRWHISLTSWFRDYLYIPMGGSRRSAGRIALNLVTVFVLCGFWHGPKWNYIWFGLYHGIFLSMERVPRYRNFIDNLWRPLQHVYVIYVWWIGLAIFQAHNMGQTWVFLRTMHGFPVGESLRTSAEFLTPLVSLAFPIAAIGSLPLLPALQRWFAGKRDSLAGAARARFEGLGAVLVNVAVLLLLFLSALELAASTHNPFIYFRF
ncbi:MAG: alginate O-acetyltransferase complex protein AlgI [Planctomycetota bacterium]|jgi:alginate O-acetyltransferase complex protein AlgI